MLKVLLFAALPLSALQVPGQAAAPVQDPGRLAAAARLATFRYESLQRRLAPETSRSGRGAGECDELIGRFCFWYDSPSEPPPPPPEPEKPEVAEARTVAVRAHRRWFAAAPGDTEAAGFLIRYLVEEGRTGEAVSAARTHAWAADRHPDALLVLGLARHEAGDFAGAEAAFDSALAAMKPERRRSLEDVRMLLERKERGLYGELSDEERARYHERFWALADPSLLQPGNERRSAHFARHAWVRIHERAPRVRGKISWGKDHEEILIRFGLPVSRSRIRDYRLHAFMEDPSFIESFDPGARALVYPALLTRGLPAAPPPGVRHELARDTAPSSYAPVRLRLAPLDLLFARLPMEGGALLRVEAVLEPDTLPPRVPVAPRGILVVFDTLGREFLREPATLRRRADSAAVLSASAALPPGDWVYRIEVLDDSTGLAGLSQYRIRIDDAWAAARSAEEASFTLSDLIVAEPFGDTLPRSHDDPVLQPHPSPVLPTGSPVGLYAEARGVAEHGQYTVEWSVERQTEGTIFGQAARWLGRTLGLIEGEEPLRIRWDELAAGGAAPIAVNMDLSTAEAGLYLITLRVTDRVTRESRSAERLLRLTAPKPSPARY